MIKTEYGSLRLKGSKQNLYADLSVIIGYLFKKSIMTPDDIHRLIDAVSTICAETVTPLSGKFGEAEIKTEKAKENTNADRLGELIKKIKRMIDQAID